MQTIPSVDIYELQRSLQYQLKLQAAGVVYAPSIFNVPIRGDLVQRDLCAIIIPPVSETQK